MKRSLLVVTLLVATAVVVVAVVGSSSSALPPTTASSPTATEPAVATTDAGVPSTVAVTDEPVTLPGDIARVVGEWTTNWNRRTIDLDELKVGINATDPRDLIRPLDFPTYEAAADGDQWLVDNEIGVLFEIEGVARFYPLRILTAHEVVNDEVAGIPFAVTYCPLCNTATAFDRRVDGDVLRFGVSGLLRKSDLVMWDDVTQSLWQQISGEGIVGEHAGTQLTFLPTATVTWADFKAKHPDGEVLSQNTGLGRNYGSNGYVGYTSQGGPFGRFFSDEIDPRFPALERVVGVRVGEVTKAYPFSVLSKANVVNDTLAATPITVWWADTGATDNFDSARPGEGQVIGTGIAFLSTVGDQVLTFSSAGDGTFVDAETSTTWTLFGEGIEGPLAGSHLETALHQNEFWFAWAAFNEGSPVHGA
ncbi:MAG: DUF3179 domain-containing protein [Acidimicrobiia bacterium]